PLHPSWRPAGRVNRHSRFVTHLLRMQPIPRLMRAAALEKFGGPEVLTLHTAGVGSWDAEMREGWSPGSRPKLPLILRSDGSGTIAKIGSQVRGFKAGDEVFAYSFGTRRGASTPSRCRIAQ